MQPVERVEVQCMACGKPHERRVTEISNNKTGRFFCSNACLRAIGGKPRRGVEYPCASCGKPVYRTPSSVRAEVFCSMVCRDEEQRRHRIFKICDVCGEEFWLRKSQAGYRPNAVCSADCNNRRRITTGIGRTHNGKPAIKDAGGYIRVWEPDHPNCFRGGWVLEHRLVVEGVVGRYLNTDEHVHHLNGVKHDNRPENLQLLSKLEHMSITSIENWQNIKKADALAAKVAEYERRFGPL